MATQRTFLPKLLLLVVAATAGAAATAQTLDMRGTGAASAESRPASGMTQASVEAKYGTPVSKIAPVGDPPISRWVYSDFIVYFEYDRVIHTVLKR